MTAKTVPGSANIPELSDAEKNKLRKEGAEQAIRDSAAESYQYLTDGNLPGDGPGGPRWPGKSEIMQHAYIVDLPFDEFKKLVEGKEKGTPTVAEDKVAGLLELERSGKNRTDFVKVLMTRLGVKSPFEVTSAGPAYTNDVTNVTAL